MGLFLLILVFLIVAAALGFAVGWLVRGARLQAELASPDAGEPAPLAQPEGERDRLRAELAATGRGDAAAGQRAATEASKAAARAAELERELAQARKVNASHQAEVGRLEARIAELEASSAGTGAKAAPAGTDHLPAAAPGVAPQALVGPEGEPDDLKLISGIGPGIERTLHDLGIFHFRQIAAFTPENIAWVNRRLRFKGRIEREDWIGQAKRLAAGDAPLP